MIFSINIWEIYLKVFGEEKELEFEKVVMVDRAK